ncbi:hypothetical protein DIPPA_07009 [Diplonema papillatum]|nr:hypothetical protein DIPPA_07009 [Diplonema papillatum]
MHTYAAVCGDRPPPGSGGAEAWLKASLEADNAVLLDKSDQLALENTQLREALLHSRDRAVAGMAAGRPPQSAPAQPAAASLPQQRADAPYHSVPPLPQHLLPSPPRPVQVQGGGYPSELSSLAHGASRRRHSPGGAEAWLKASLEADNAALLDKSDQLALENTQLREALLHSRDRAVAGMAAGRPPQSAPAQPGAASLPQQRADAPYHSVPPLPQHLLPSPPRPVQTQGGGYASELSNHSQASHTAPAVENRSSQPLSDAIPSLPQPQGSGHAFMFPSVGVPSPFHHSPLYNVGPPAPQVSPAGAHLVQPFTSAPSVGLPSLPMTPTGIGRGIDTAQDRLRSVNSNLGKLTDLLHKSARHDAGPVDHRQV